MEPFIFTVRTELNGSLWSTNVNDSVQYVNDSNGFLMTEDNLANRIVVEVYQNHQKVALASNYGVYASITKHNGTTLRVNGSISDGNAMVNLPSSVYTLDGELLIDVHVTNDNKDKILASIDTHIKKTVTQNNISYENGILSVDESEYETEIGDLLPDKIKVKIKSGINISQLEAWFAWVENQNGEDYLEFFELPFVTSENIITIDAPEDAYVDYGPFYYVISTEDGDVLVSIHGYVDDMNIQ